MDGDFILHVLHVLIEEDRITIRVDHHEGSPAPSAVAGSMPTARSRR